MPLPFSRRNPTFSEESLLRKMNWNTFSEKDFKPAKSSFHNYFSLRQPKCPMKIIFPKMSFFSVINNYFCCFLFATCFYFRAYSFEISLILITPKLNPRSLSKILFFKINLPDSNLNQKIDHTPKLAYFRITLMLM